jgi:hypothetical protein
VTTIAIAVYIETGISKLLRRVNWVKGKRGPMAFGRVRKMTRGATATYTKYVNRDSSKDTHKNEGLVVGTDDSKEKCANHEEGTVDG